MDTLAELKKQKMNGMNPEDLNFGYCIPDCGLCCESNDLHQSPTLAKIFARELDIDPKDIFLDGKWDETPGVLKSDPERDHCIFLYGYSQCLLHNKKRPTTCMIFGSDGCIGKYNLTAELVDSGYDMPGLLKKIWLGRLKDGYDRFEWLADAKRLIIDTHIREVLSKK